MKKVIFISIFTLAALHLCAQEPVKSQTSHDTFASQQDSSNKGTITSIPKTDMLASFNSIEIEGPINVKIRQIAKGDTPYIIYDTKGSEYSRFKQSINRNGVLKIEERNDTRRESRTDVIIYFDSISAFKAAQASVAFESVIETTLLDMVISSGAKVSADIKTLDTSITCTGNSALILEGESRYVTINASTAKMDCLKLSAVSVTVDASHNSEVSINVAERLEAKTSTSAVLLYLGNPSIIRNHTSTFGGEIRRADE